MSRAIERLEESLPHTSPGAADELPDWKETLYRIIAFTLMSEGCVFAYANFATHPALAWVAVGGAACSAFFAAKYLSNSYQRFSQLDATSKISFIGLTLVSASAIPPIFRLAPVSSMSLATDVSIISGIALGALDSFSVLNPFIRNYFENTSTIAGESKGWSDVAWRAFIARYQQEHGRPPFRQEFREFCELLIPEWQE